MRKLVTLRKVSKLTPIPNADKIEKATVDGWECVVKKDEFQEGEWGIYFEIDSMIPHKDWSNHLFKNQKDIDRGFLRIKSIRLKNQISQGLMLPLSLLLDTDLTEVIGVYKYEPPVPEDMSAKSRFPSFISKTDEERCLSKESIIITEDGEKTAQEICETKYFGNVLSYNIITDEEEWKPINSHSIMRNNNDWYEIELDDGSVRRFTGNELIYLPELMAYRRVDDLIGDEEVIFHKKN